jgi:hypothetical protein
VASAPAACLSAAAGGGRRSSGPDDRGPRRTELVDVVVELGAEEIDHGLETAPTGMTT